MRPVLPESNSYSRDSDGVEPNVARLSVSTCPILSVGLPNQTVFVACCEEMLNELFQDLALFDW